MGLAFQDDILDSLLPAQRLFLRRIAVFVHDEIVRFDLAQFFESSPGAQWGEQIDFAFAQQAQAQTAIGGQAGAVAGGAERDADR